jgi:hypothetical protein
MNMIWDFPVFYLIHLFWSLKCLTRNCIWNGKSQNYFLLSDLLMASSTLKECNNRLNEPAMERECIGCSPGALQI